MAGQGNAQLILASASQRRLDLLRQAGLEPDAVVPAEIDETPLKDELPRAYARCLFGRLRHGGRGRPTDLAEG